MNEKYRLITRSDMDGLVCGTLLSYLEIIDEIVFAHPKDVQDGKLTVSSNDIIANLPYVENAYLVFDHHFSETLRNEKKDNHIIDSNSPSAAQVIYDYYDGDNTFPGYFTAMMNGANKADSADFNIDDILEPIGWSLLSFIMDSRTGLGRFKDFKITNQQLLMDLIKYLAKHNIDEIIELVDVKERVDLYFKYEKEFKEQLKNVTIVKDNLLILDYRNEEIIYPGNRFMIYAMNPKQNISIHILWVKENEIVSLSVGKSIINKSSKTNIGELMLKYGGGGHKAAGGCQIHINEVEKVLEELTTIINQNG
jgi:nanoRNase/pAp phosphatase (c-di-AMP/oligoRNAs hydrolase)